jgi:hypothetical protein
LLPAVFTLYNAPCAIALPSAAWASAGRLRPQGGLHHMRAVCRCNTWQSIPFLIGYRFLTMRVCYIISIFVVNMIQRIQSIYLLLAAIASSLVFIYPPFLAPSIEPIISSSLKTASSISLFSSILVIVISILMYKRRLFQMRLIATSILLLFIAILFDALSLFSQSSNGITYSFTFNMIFPFLAFVFSVLARRAIRKDEQLVRSADRIR